MIAECCNIINILTPTYWTQGISSWLNSPSYYLHTFPNVWKWGVGSSSYLLRINKWINLEVRGRSLEGTAFSKRRAERKRVSREEKTTEIETKHHHPRCGFLKSFYKTHWEWHSVFLCHSPKWLVVQEPEKLKKNILVSQRFCMEELHRAVMPPISGHTASQ